MLPTLVWLLGAGCGDDNLGLGRMPLDTGPLDLDSGRAPPDDQDSGAGPASTGDTFEPTGPYSIPEGATVYRYDPVGQLSTFPDDFHTTDDAQSPTGLRVVLQSSPEAIAEVMPAAIHEALEELDGFGTTAGLELRFDAAVDPGTFHADTVHLFQLDGSVRGPDLGWDVTWYDQGTTAILSPRLPLEPARRYALVADRGVLDLGGARVWAPMLVHELLTGQAQADPRLQRLVPRYTDLAAALVDELDPADVAAAVVFTTQSVGGIEPLIAAALDASPPTFTAGKCTPSGDGLVCVGTLHARDFLGTDGVLSSEEEQAPVIQRTYDIPVNAYLPSSRGPFPVVIYGHGLGGKREDAAAAALALADLGLAVVSLDAPMHGEHPTAQYDTSVFQILDFFGIHPWTLEIDALQLRDHWRQAAWDKLQLVRVLAEGLDVSSDDATDLMGTEIYYTGHSLGGIMGPQFLAFAPEVGAAYLSVPGGRVTSILDGGEAFDAFQLALDGLGTDDDVVARFFPYLQAVIERGDAANYAAAAATDRDVHQTMVMGDTIIPNTSSEVLARAMGVELGEPSVAGVPDLATAGEFPVRGNVEGHTKVLLQLDTMVADDGTLEPAQHTDLFTNAINLTALHHWFATARAVGPAQAIDPYAELGLR